MQIFCYLNNINKGNKNQKISGLGQYGSIIYKFS